MVVITYQSFVVRTPQPHHPDRHLHRRAQGLSAADGLSEAALARPLPCARPELRGHRLRVLHPHARRSHRLEHAPRRATAGCRRFRAPSTSSIATNTNSGRRTRARRRRPAHSPAVWQQNCRPIVEAGRAELVDGNFALDDTIFLSESPGHSPHHYCVHIRSRGQEAVVSGDLMHHALQCREPDWSTIFCWDMALAAQTRRRFLQTLRRHQHAGGADPLPGADRRPHRTGRRALPLQIRV